MAKIPAKSMKMWLGQYALAARLTGAGVDVTQELAKSECLGDEGPRRVVGNYDYAFPFMGLFDGAAGELDAIVHALLGSASDHYVTLALGSAVGDVAYDGAVSLAGKPLSASLGSVQALNLDLSGRAGLSRGVLLGNGTTTQAESLASVNMGTTIAGQVFRAIFRVITFDGTDITLKVQESQQDDGDPDTFADITGVTSGALTAAGVVAAQSTAATEAYKRLNISGTFTSAVIAVSAGVVAGT